MRVTRSGVDGRGRRVSSLAVSRVIALVAAILAAACGPGNPGGPGFDRTKNLTPLESADILGRTGVNEQVWVKHVLVGWDELAPNYGGRMTEAAKKRSRLEAERLVRRVVGELDEGAPIEPLMLQYSDDRGTRGGKALEVRPGSKFVPKFEALALRLEVGEHGVVKTPFGYHVVVRVR